MTVINPFDFFVEPYAEHYPFAYAPALAKELIPFLETAPPGPRLAAWLERFRATHRARREARSTCWCGSTSSCSARSRYLVRMEPGVQTPEETLASASGSCRDTGWLLVQILRHLGLAARFASGYLIQLVADVKPLDGPPGPSAISPTCTPGPRSICRAPAGSGSTRRRACSPAKATFRSRAPPIRATPRR